MKKLFFLFLFLIPSLIYAQQTGSLNISSENGDKFFLFLDGKKQNDTAYSNIRISNLPDLYYSARIVFADSTISPVSKNNLYASDGEDMMRDAYYRIRREKAGKPRLVFFSMLSAEENFVPKEGTYVFKFGKPSIAETMPVALEKKASIPAPAAASTLASLHIFSQNGDKFFLYLNAVKQNETAQANIRIQEVPGLYYNVKIVFKDAKIPPIIKNNLFVSDSDDSLMDAAYRIRRDKTGKPKLNFYSMKPVQENFIAPAGMYVYEFGKPASGIASSTPKKTSAQNTQSMFTNIKVTDAGAKKPGTKPASPGINPSKAKETTAATSDFIKPSTKIAATVAKPADPAPANPENKKCNGWPMGKGDLAAAKQIIEAAAKEEAKLKAAQDIIVSNCLLTSQVAEFCNLFKSEKSKLAFAKYAYKYTIDRKNYAEVNKALSLETSKKELNKFINGG